MAQDPVSQPLPPVSDLERETKKAPDLFVRLGGSSFPHGKFADASYSDLAFPDPYGQALVQFDQFTFVKGVNLILGGSSSGKTTLVNKLADLTGWEKNVYFEPVPESRTSIDSLCKLLHDFISDKKGPQGIIIDSFKALIYSSGNLSRGGINQSILQELSNLSTIAARSGKVIIATVNLITEDEQVYKSFEEAAVGSLAGLITLPARGKARVRLRDFVNGDRIDENIDWTPNVVGKGKSESTSKAGAVTIEVQSNSSFTDAIAIASRSLHTN